MSKKTFQVDVPAPTWLRYEVKADSMAEAVMKVTAGKGTEDPDISYFKAIDGNPKWDEAIPYEEVN
jgi:hypothetical protein